MVTNVEDESFLRRRQERVKLLRAGFSGKEIEALYVILNHVEVIGVNWHDLSIKFDRDCAAALTNEELDRIMDRMPCYRCHPLIKTLDIVFCERCWERARYGKAGARYGFL